MRPRFYLFYLFLFIAKTNYPYSIIEDNIVSSLPITHTNISNNRAAFFIYESGSDDKETNAVLIRYILSQEIDSINVPLDLWNVLWQEIESSGNLLKYYEDNKSNYDEILNNSEFNSTGPDILKLILDTLFHGLEKCGNEIKNKNNSYVKLLVRFKSGEGIFMIGKNIGLYTRSFKIFSESEDTVLQKDSQNIGITNFVSGLCVYKMGSMLFKLSTTSSEQAMVTNLIYTGIPKSFAEHAGKNLYTLTKTPSYKAITSGLRILGITVIASDFVLTVTHKPKDDFAIWVISFFVAGFISLILYVLYACE